MRQHSGEFFDPGGDSSGLTPRQSGTDGSPEMLVFAADHFEDAEAVIAAVRSGRTVVLNIAGLPEAVGQRLVDFVCGGITAMDGQVHRIGEDVFLLASALARVEPAQSRAMHGIPSSADQEALPFVEAEGA